MYTHTLYDKRKSALYIASFFEIKYTVCEFNLNGYFDIKKKE